MKKQKPLQGTEAPVQRVSSAPSQSGELGEILGKKAKWFQVSLHWCMFRPQVARFFDHRLAKLLSQGMQMNITSTRRQWILGTAIALSWVMVSSLRAVGSQMLRGRSSLKRDGLGFKNPNAWVTEINVRNPQKEYRCLSGMRPQMHRSPQEDDPEVTMMPRSLKRAARRRWIEWIYLCIAVEYTATYNIS